MKAKQLIGLWALPCLLLTGILGLSSCKQEPEATQSEDVVETDAKEAVVAAQETEQTTCPVMEGKPIDKTIFVEYQGKKVYFCCEPCPEKFNADPAKYVANLPQFNQITQPQ